MLKMTSPRSVFVFRILYSKSARAISLSIADEALLVKDAGTLTPGIGEAVALKNVYDVWGQSGVQGEDKIAATAETGADLASSYAIASANPFAMAAGGAYKAGKFLWDIYAK